MTKAKGASQDYAKLPKKMKGKDSELKVDEHSTNLLCAS